MAESGGPERTSRGGVQEPVTHDSAELHVSGEARYIDDIPEPPDLLHAYVVMSPRAHARIKSIDVSRAAVAPGVGAVIIAADIPGRNDVGPMAPDEPILAEKTVEYIGEPVAAIAATSIKAARRAAGLVRIDYEDLPPVLSIEEALEKKSYVFKPAWLKRGNAARGLAAAPRRLKGELRIGGQDHFYLEGQVAMALPQEGGDMLVLSSSQHPSEIQKMTARLLSRPLHAVTVEVRRMGGGFGGKETQPAIFAGIAAVLADKAKRPVKLRLDRDDDMMITGKRHDFLIRYDAGYDDSGRLLALDMVLASRAGPVADLSPSILERALFHADNAYYIQDVQLTGYACKTNTQSNTAFRGFGGPQGMLAIENLIDDIARLVGKDPLEVRKLNYYGTDTRNVTPYHQVVEDNILPELTAEIERDAEYAGRRRAIDEWNRNSPVLKKGLGFVPVKFGISFTTTFLNQGGALVHVYTDGSVSVNHGGTEMGQGLMTKIAQIVAEEFHIDVALVKVTATNTGKVPNTSATAASAGTDLNGMAARNAAREIRTRLAAFAATHFKIDPMSVRFEANRVYAGGRDIPFEELIGLAYLGRVSLSSTGFYKTPLVRFDRETGSGKPFFYFAYGVAVVETLVDTLTGEYKVLRADLLHDVGKSINPAIDMGQIEGGFIQGMGWLTTEELWWDKKGALKTHAPSTYKIPVARDLPADFRAKIYERSVNKADTIHRSKAVGEPPLMLGIAVWLSLKDAISVAADHRVSPRLDAPATPERVLAAIEEARARSGENNDVSKTGRPRLAISAE